MGFWEGIFGHGASDPSWLKGGVRGTLDDFQKYLQMAWSPQAVRGRVANFTGNLDRSLAQYQQAGNAQYGQRGLRATPQTAYRRGFGVANFADEAQQQAYQGMLQGNQSLLGMYMNAQPLFHRAASGGLVGALAPLAEAYGQYAAMAGGGKSPASSSGQVSTSFGTSPGLPFAGPASYPSPTPWQYGGLDYTSYAKPKPKWQSGGLNWWG